ncbi:DNA polymerase III subunit beta [Paenibacillus sp. J31TS4]|uniref:DNA polymerase III subunit beta n=1 Tax=Paenibacillus sp. J31TS4 TaxID=2807195 RepID=UPI001BCCD20F|nr:DNA polymerase III subunit beta [Paenibacillus sp. J31TS4]
MRIHLSRTSLAEGLQAVVRAAPAASSVPTHGGLRLEASPDGVTLTMVGGIASARYELPAEKGRVEVERTGAAVVPASYLYELVRRLDDGPVTLERTNSFHLTVASPGMCGRLSGIDPDLFPQAPVPGPEASALRLPNSVLRRMIRQVAFAVSNSDSRPVLTGVLCRLVGHRLTMTATDGVRLATASCETERLHPSADPEQEVSAVLPGRMLTGWARLLTDGGWTDIRLGPREAAFQTGCTSLYSVVLTGAYPPVDKLLPGSLAAEWTMAAPALLQTVERVALLAGKEALLHLRSTEPGVIELTACSADIGELREEIRPDSLSGEPISVSVNGRYLADTLRAADGQRVTVQITGSRSPLVIRPADDPGSLYLLTPVRTRESA